MKRKTADPSWTMTDLRAGERIDDLQRNGLRIIQDPERFCFGMDAVLLSGYAAVPAGAGVLDLGSGTGIIPILLSAKTKASQLVGLEIQAESADMAERSVRLNHLEERVRIIQGDIREAAELFDAASFDVVTANPPYMPQGHGLVNPEDAKALARHEIACSLEDVIKAAAYCLKESGTLAMVHRPFRLTDIFSAMRKHRLEPKRMRLVYPREDKEPAMVLIEGRKGGNPCLSVEKPLIIYGPDGKYTEEITEVYGY